MVWMVACGPSPAVVGDAPGAPFTSPQSPTLPPATSALGDVVLVQELVAGRATPEDVIPAIAWSGGWPVRDGDQVWVVAWAEGTWSVAGDFDGWVGQPMTAGAGFSWALIDAGPEPAGSRYKLVADGAWLADPWARSYTYDAFGEISYVLAPTDEPRLDRWPGLAGQGLAPRDLRVWVPAGDGPWPVIYAHDGQNLFDPGAIWGGWRLQDSLAVREPVLVVGIDNTGARMDEYTHVPDDIGYGEPIGGLGEDYATFVEEDVRPHVEAVYGSTGHVGLLGSSLGGLISLYAAARRPERYTFAAGLSSTLGWGVFGHGAAGPTVEALWLAEASTPPVYVDSGGGPGVDGGCDDADGDGYPEDDADAADNYCETRQFADALAASGRTWDVDLWHWWEPEAPHQETAWAERVGRPLDVFLSLD